MADDMVDPIQRLHQHFDAIAERQERELQELRASRAERESPDLIQAGPQRPPAPEPSAAAPAGPRQPPQAVLDAVTDPDRGGAVRFQGVGPLHGIPAHDAQPEVVRRFAELTADQGAYLGGLPERAGAIGLMGVAQDRAVAAIKLPGEVERFAGPAEIASRSQAGALRAAAAKLEGQLLERGGDLEPEDSRRLATWFLALAEDDRVAFLGKAERDGDHAALRAIALDPMTRYAAPSLDREQLVQTAGRLRAPRTAALAGAYQALADRAEANAGRVAALTAEAARAARQHVTAADLEFANRLQAAN